MSESFSEPVPPEQSPILRELQEMNRQMQQLHGRLDRVERRLHIRETPSAAVPDAADVEPPSRAEPSRPVRSPWSPTAPLSTPPSAPRNVPTTSATSLEPTLPLPLPMAPTVSRETTAEVLRKLADAPGLAPKAQPPFQPVTPAPFDTPSAVAAPVPTPPLPAPSPVFTSPTISVPAPHSTVPPYSPPRYEAREEKAPPLAPFEPSLPRIPTVDLENLIGGRWALWMGSFTLFLAAASFLAYKWQIIPAWAKLAMGLGGGLALMALGGLSRPRTQRWFSEGMSGAGLAISYLSLWAGAQLLHYPATGTRALLPLLSHEVAFTAMAALTALGVYLAVRYDALSLSVLSTAGGFLTPVLLHSNANSPTLSLLIYVAVLDSGILGVSLFKRWRTLTWLSLMASVLLLGGWAGQTDFSALRILTFTFATYYFALYFGAACFYSLAHGEDTADEDLILIFVASSLYALCGHLLIAPSIRAFPGTFSLGLALFYASAGLAVRILAPKNTPLRYSVGGLALLALTVTVPMQMKQQWLPIGWTVEAAVLLLLSRRLRSTLLQRAGQIIWVISLWPLIDGLFSAQVSKPQVLLLNSHALPLFVSTVAAAMVALDLHFAARRDRQDRAITPWQDELSHLSATFAVWGGAWLLAQETYFAFSWHHAASDKSWQAGALFTTTILGALYSLLVFTGSLRWRHPILRLNALIVALLAAALPVWAGVSQDTPQWMPFWNLRLLAFAVTCLVWIQMGRLTLSASDEMLEEESKALGVWPVIAGLLALSGATIELYFSFAQWHRPGNINWEADAFFAIAMLWGAFATLMALQGCLWRQTQLRNLGYVLGCGAIGMVLYDATFADIDATPLFNLRFGAFGLLIAAVVLAASGMNRYNDDLSEWERGLPSNFAVLAAALGLWGATQETYETCRFFQNILGVGWQNAAFFAIAILWGALATLLLDFGCRYANSSLRMLAYFAAAFTVPLLLGNAVGGAPALHLYARPLLNLRFMAFVLEAGAFVALASRLQRHRDKLSETEVSLAAGFGLTAALLMLWTLTQETFETCRYCQSSLGEHWRLCAWFCIAILWQSGAAFLLTSGLQRRELSWRHAAYLLGAAATGPLLITSLSESQIGWTPLLNVRWLAFFVTGTAWAISALRMNEQRATLEARETEMIRGIGLLAAMTIGWGLTQEAYETCFYFKNALGPNWDRWAQMAISSVWSLYGALLLIGGINRQYQPVRLIALGLLAITIIKVFVFDLSFLSGTPRIFALAGLGLSLIFISWLYGRFGTGNPSGRDKTQNA